MEVLIAIETILGSRTCSATVWVNKRCSSPPEKQRATPEDGLPLGSAVSLNKVCSVPAILKRKMLQLSSLNHSISPRTHSPAQSQTGVEPQSTSSSHGSFGKKCQSRAWLMMASASWLTLQLNITPANNNYLHKFRNILKQTMLINASVFSKFELPTSHSNSSRPRNWIRRRFVASAWQQKNLRKKGTKNGAEVSKIILPSSIGNLL